MRRSGGSNPVFVCALYGTFILAGIFSISCGNESLNVGLINTDVDMTVYVGITPSITIDSQLGVTITMDGSVVVDLPQALPPELQQAIRDKVNEIFSNGQPTEQQAQEAQAAVQKMITDFINGLVAQTPPPAEGGKQIQPDEASRTKIQKEYQIDLVNDQANLIRSGGKVAMGHDIQIDIKINHRDRKSAERFMRIACSSLGEMVESSLAKTGTSAQKKALKNYQDHFKPILCLNQSRDINPVSQMGTLMQELMPFPDTAPPTQEVSTPQGTAEQSSPNSTSEARSASHGAIVLSIPARDALKTTPGTHDTVL